MSAPDTTQMHDTIRTVALGGAKTNDNARTVFNSITQGWDLPTSYIGDGQVGVNVSQLKRAWYEDAQSVDPSDDEETTLERLYGTRHPFVGAMLTGPAFDPDRHDARDAESVLDHTRDATPDNGRALVDSGVVKAASPVEVDPMIVDVQRSKAPILDIIPSIAQPGFSAQYNVFDSRTLEDWAMTESDAADLTDNVGSTFTLNTATKDMKIHATVLNVSDFSQRAEESLDYMDLMNTTVGQVMKEIFLTKAKTWLYGDPGAGGTGLHENANEHEGLAKMAADAGNVVDKTGTTSGYLEDILDYITQQVVSSGLSFANARVLCSLPFYNQIYDETTPVVRIDGYDAPVEYGPRGINIGHERGTVQITPLDNIRDYQSESSGVGSNSTNGDVFLYDESAVQYRELAPMSTVPLGRDGLSDKAAIFDYGTLVDKSQGEHTHRLRYGSVN